MITRRTMLVGGAASGLTLPYAAKAEARPVRVGVLEDMSGVFSELGGPGTLVAARMAAQDFGGSVLGRPVEIIGGDHQNKPDVGGTIARQWFDVDKVGMITGLTNSAVALTVHQLAAEKNGIDIVVNAASDSLIEENCSPNGFLWNQSARAIVTATVQQAGKGSDNSWFFITSDYAGGRVMEDEATPLIRTAGGTLKGSAHPPVGTTDFSSELLSAQASGAKLLGVVTFGQDFANIMKQVVEFGLTPAMRPVAPFVFHSDLHAVGPSVIGGMTVAAAFYWDLNPDTRTWSERFRKLTGRAPDMGHGGAYTAVTHYLKSIQHAGTVETGAVLSAMRDLHVSDMYTDGARIRKDGMVLRQIHLFEGKAPAESRDSWDLLRKVGTVEPDVAFPVPVGAKCRLLNG